MNFQPGILAAVPDHARYLEFDFARPGNLSFVCGGLHDLGVGSDLVLGLGASLFEPLKRAIPNLCSFPNFDHGPPVPSTQADLWVCIRGNGIGDNVHRAMEVKQILGGEGTLVRQLDGFKYDTGRDLTGYEDGTENPVGQEAMETAFVTDAGPGLDGSSYVAVQQWAHDFDAFNSLSREEQDRAIGRYRETNEEFDAPESAHVKRTAQESFDPEAFLLRRSLPWSNASGSGLMFVGFGRNFDAFEVQMHRMTGRDDGIVDGLFRFSRPITGGYYWCPPVNSTGRLDLSRLNPG